MSAFPRIYVANMRQICLIMTNLFKSDKKIECVKIVFTAMHYCGCPYFSFLFYNLEILYW